MNREMFMNLIWPTLVKSIEDKGFKPGLLSNKIMENGIYIVLSPEVDCSLEAEKQFRDIVIDLLTRCHIPFENKSDELCTYIYIDLIKLTIGEMYNG